MNADEHDIVDERAMLDVLAERERQDAKWGEQNHDPFTWLAILGEEYGECCKEALEMKFANVEDPSGYLANFRSELVQTAAVALAIIECLDRGVGYER